jgi:tRNA 5-methylaminomethyl-2-thiouridine biosynthesis bifunctional protein
MNERGKSTHQHLCATPKPDLEWRDDGSPLAREFDDIYFSVDGGLAETKNVFIKGCGLPDAWHDKDVFTVGELGFGSGLNFLAVWDEWLKTAREDQRLHFVSIEAFPFSQDQFRQAIKGFSALQPLGDQLCRHWPGQVKGVHRLHFGNVTLSLFHMDVDTALPQMNARINAWFLDGFSPAKNPDMWSADVFNHLARLSHPYARVATFTVAGHVRRGLSEAGFDVTKKPGFGRKRERLEAIYAGDVTEARHTHTLPPIILGGGIAGASVCRAFERRNMQPILIDPDPKLDTAASGNPAAMVSPRLDVQDRPESRFFNAAYLYALAAYEAAADENADCVLSRGITHLAQTPEQAKRFSKLANLHALPPSHLKSLPETNISSGGLAYDGAALINPKAVITRWTQSATRINKAAARLENTDGMWTVYDKDGEILAQSSLVFMCVGANVLSVAQPYDPADIRFTKGQICWGDIPGALRGLIPKRTLSYGGYAAPYQRGVLLGATHDHVGPGQDADTNHADSVKNWDQFLTAIHPEQQENLPSSWHARASVRVTTTHTLPLAYPLDDNLIMLSGLGSRGFMVAPLLGEALVSEALSEPSPLCTHTKMRFGPREKT